MAMQTHPLERLYTEILSAYVFFCMGLGSAFAIFPKLVYEILIWLNLTKRYIPKKYDMKGKFCIVTGGASGIGLAVVKRFVEYGAKVIVADCNLKGREIVDEINKKKISEGSVEFMYLDLADFSSVETFIADLRAKYTTLDILVNNAGIGAPPKYAKSKDGYELTIQINYLSHYLLTMKLEDMLRQNPNSRVLFTSSVTHRFGSHSITSVRKLAHTGECAQPYATSKLGLILLANKLLRRRAERQQFKIPKIGPIAVCVDPGAVRSNIWNDCHIPGFKYIPIILKKIFLSTDEVSHLFTFAANDQKAITYPFWSLHPDPDWVNKYVPFAKRTGFFVQHGALVGPCKAQMILPDSKNERLLLEDNYFYLAGLLTNFIPLSINAIKTNVKTNKNKMTQLQGDDVITSNNNSENTTESNSAKTPDTLDKSEQTKEEIAGE